MCLAVAAQCTCLALGVVAVTLMQPIERSLARGWLEQRGPRALETRSSASAESRVVAKPGGHGGSAHKPASSPLELPNASYFS